ncbi:hypothetical protein ACRALDRAFT_2095732 [Sodiomyces alcalophilus JCM 7366]|uniref:uncharacterized protein n=1 Tax=Sodiomyces alcalophilus JCM 7366 TaxID=591952 RepID=UPI0039B4AEA0
MSDIQARQGGSGRSTALLGDLIHLSDRRLTRTGREIKAILSGTGNPQDLTSSYILGAPPLGSWLCDIDTCCVWKHIADEMAPALTGSAGRCNDLARALIRLGFHDAGTWDIHSEGTGADGSIALTDECNRTPENNGLGTACDQVRAWHAKYASHGVSMADVIQFAAQVATVVCPLGPRIRFFAGRKDVAVEGPRGLLPGPFDDADRIIEMFANKTISTGGIVALLGAHSASQQHTVDVDRAGDPQDSTPGVWDTDYFSETLDTDAPSRVFKFQSDINIANDPRTHATWRSYADPSAQSSWNEAYAAEYIRVSLLGVPKLNTMTECSRALPPFRGTFEAPDQSQLDRFMQGLLDTATDVLYNGDSIPADLQ